MKKILLPLLVLLATAELAFAGRGSEPDSSTHSLKIDSDQVQSKGAELSTAKDDGSLAESGADGSMTSDKKLGSLVEESQKSEDEVTSDATAKQDDKKAKQDKTTENIQKLTDAGFTGR